MNHPMKTTLQILMILLGLGAAVISFASLVGVGSSSMFFGSETAIIIYSMAGLLLTGLADSARAPMAVRARTATMAMAASAAPGGHAPACRLGRAVCSAV